MTSTSPTHSRLTLWQRYCVKLEPVIHKLIAQFPRYSFLKQFNLFITKFDDLAGMQVDQVIMMFFRYLFVARPPISEIVTFQNTGIFEQSDRPVNRGNGNPVIYCGCPAIYFFHIGVIVGFGQDPRNDTTLVRHAHPFFDTDVFQKTHLNNHCQS